MSNLYRCIIVEDEELLAGVLKSYLSHFSQLELVAICQNPLEADAVLKEEAIDLMFLDIEMPHMSGVDFLKTILNPPLVIFTTAYSEYAINGFEHNAVDYLLKPVKLSRFLTAVNKFLERITTTVKEPDPLSISPSLSTIIIKSDGRLIRLKHIEITYIEGLREYVRFHTEKGDKYIVLRSLINLEEELPSDSFMRIHRSFIVNKHFVSIVEGNQVSVNNTVLGVSKSYKKAFMNWFINS